MSCYVVLYYGVCCVLICVGLCFHDMLRCVLCSDVFDCFVMLCYFMMCSDVC
jgi:hypothetical protein